MKHNVRRGTGAELGSSVIPAPRSGAKRLGIKMKRYLYRYLPKSVVTYLTYVLDELLFVAVVLGFGGSLQLFAGRHSFLLQGRQAPGKHRLACKPMRAVRRGKLASHGWTWGFLYKELEATVPAKGASWAVESMQDGS